jgi:hypothetical protein
LYLLEQELKAKSNFEKEMKKIQAKFQEERKKTDYLKMMLAAAAKSNSEFPGASQMLHLQGICMLIVEIIETCMSMTSTTQ